MNSTNLSGRITKELELRYTQNGVAVCAFTVAVDRPGVKDKTDFIDCVAWRHTAEFVSKYFCKGDPIEIAGCLTTRNYEDKNGNKRKAVEVVCEHIGFPKQKKKQDGEVSSNEQCTQGYGQEIDYSDEDLPF